MMLHFNKFFCIFFFNDTSYDLWLFLHQQNKTFFFFEIPDNVKIISVTITKLIGGKMTPNHSMDVMNTFSVIYSKGHKCHNFTKLEQKKGIIFYLFYRQYLCNWELDLSAPATYVQLYCLEKKPLKLFLNCCCLECLKPIS